MPHRLNAFLTSGLELGRLTGKARQLVVLQQRFELIVPPSLKRGCRVMHLNQQTLTLAADNGAVAAKLRQMTVELAAKLRETGCEVTVIQVQVQVSAPPHIEPPHAHLLSLSGRKHLVQFAENLAESPLKDALNRWAHRN